MLSDFGEQWLKPGGVEVTVAFNDVFDADDGIQKFSPSITGAHEDLDELEPNQVVSRCDPAQEYRLRYRQHDGDRAFLTWFLEKVPI